MPELGGNLLNLVRFPRSSSIFDYSDYIISTTTTSLAELVEQVETVETNAFHYLIRLFTLTPQGYYS